MGSASTLFDLASATTPLGAAGGFYTAIGNSMAFDPRHYKIPRTYQYSLGFQRQLPRNIVADIAFSGNLAIYGAYGLEELARRTGRAEPVRAGDAGFEP